MKKFYALMVSMFTLLAGATGCNYIETDYGIPVNNDSEYGSPYTDYDTVDVPDETIDDPINDYDITDNDVDDIPVTDCEYGAPYADYDIDTTDADTEEVSDDPVVEYGAPPVDYDDENPDEITTDYGPISTKFHK